MRGGDPEDFCPICGVLLAENHRCSHADLRRIEAARRRKKRPHRDDVSRLNEGLSMLEEDPWGDDGYDPEIR